MLLRGDAESPLPVIRTPRRRLLWRILASSALMLAVLGWGLVWTRADLQEIDEQFVTIIDRDLVMARGTAELLQHVIDMQTGLRGFQVTGLEDFLSPYSLGKRAFADRLQELRNAGGRSPDVLDRLDRVERLVESWDRETAQVAIKEVREAQAAGAIAPTLTPPRAGFERGRTTIAQVRQEISTLVHQERKRLQERRAHAIALAKRSSQRVYFSMGMALVMALAVGLYLARDIAGAIARVNDAIGALARGSTFTLEISRDDEIGTLAQNFSEMARALHQNELALRESLAHVQGLNAELVTANRVKGQFLAAMSHELRTPLHSIIGFTELLLKSRSVPPDELRDTLQRVLRNGQHLLALINDVLDLAKLDAARMVVRSIPFDAAEPVQAAIAMTEAQARDKGLELEVRYSAEGMVMASGDPQRVQQIVLNLVSNAIKFTDRGRITVEVLRGEGTVVIEVGDSGVGIPTDAVEHLFEEFHQVETGDGRSFGGTGLGLALSRRLARAMGGDVTYRPREAGGSIFALTIPAVGPSTSAPAPHPAEGQELVA